MSDMIEKDASKLESGSQLNDAGGGGHTSKVEKKIFNYEGVDGHQGSGGVQRVLKARQLQMIALGGTIGTGKSQSNASKSEGELIPNFVCERSLRWCWRSSGQCRHSRMLARLPDHVGNRLDDDDSARRGNFCRNFPFQLPLTLYADDDHVSGQRSLRALREQVRRSRIGLRPR